MQFRLLGPLEVHRAGESVPLARAKLRRLLAMLLIDADRPVSTDRLIDGLWDGRAPATAVKTLQTYVCQLRTLLEPDRPHGQLGQVVITEPTGYRLRVDGSDIDARRFDDLHSRGRGRLATAPAEAQHLLTEALALWRGPVLAEFAAEPFAQGEIARLEELRLETVEERIEADLALGEHAGLVGELHEHLREHPLRERMWGQLMLAQYRAGRQAEALQTYQQARRGLSEQIGIDPGPALRRLEEQILRQDPALEWREGSRLERRGEHGGPAAPPASPETERRWASVLRALLGQPVAQPPGVADSLADRFLERIGHEVRRRGGALLPSEQGSVSALFGLPVTHEDDPERAVRTALAIQELARSVSLPTGAITVGIGIGTGELSVRIGNATGDQAAPEPPLPGLPAALGGPGALASELAATAGPGEVLVGDMTRQATQCTVGYETATGEPGVWRAVAAEPEPTRRPLSGTRMVGRHAELGLMRTIWERTVSERRAHLVTLLGPPGIGKSRLCHEFLPLVTEHAGLVLRGRSLPYADATFGALAQMVRQVIGADHRSPPGSARWKLEAWLATCLPTEEQPQAPAHLLALLALLDDIGLTERRQMLHRSVRRFFEALAALQPTVLLFEDLHWAHPDLLSLLEWLAGRVQALPLLMVTVARPELLDARPAWGGGLPAYTMLPVDALSGSETRELTGHLLSGRRGAGAVLDTIEGATGGNPLFVEELVAWLAEGHDQTQGMPATVRSVIAARLDLLPPSERAVIVNASVLGSRFWPGGLERLTGIPPERLEESLESLERRGLIRVRPRSLIVGEREYGFRHDLFAEVAAGRLAEPGRAAKHRLVAEYLEQAGGGAVPGAMLARHWREAGDPERAITCLLEAADQANRGGERARAVALYDQALELLAGRDPQRWRRANLKRAVALQAWAHMILDLPRRPRP